MNTDHSAPPEFGTRYATLGTPIGIILMSFRLDCLLDAPLLVIELATAFGIGATTPFLGTKVETVVPKKRKIDLDAESKMRLYSQKTSFSLDDL